MTKYNSIEFFKKLYAQHKAVILYLVFGGFTTLVNIVSYAVCARIFSWGTMVATVVAWFLAVLFAYITNRKWVFGSSAADARSILLEAFTFFSCRLTTGLADLGMMWFFVVFLGCNDIVIKITANIVVIIMNYIASRWLIFRK